MKFIQMDPARSELQHQNHCNQECTIKPITSTIDNSITIVQFAKYGTERHDFDSTGRVKGAPLLHQLLRQ